MDGSDLYFKAEEDLKKRVKKQSGDFLGKNELTCHPLVCTWE